MSVTTTTLANPFGAKIIIDTDADATAEAATTSSTTLYHVRIDNTQNTADVYVKLHDLAVGSVTVGTTAPNHVFFCPSGTKLSYVMASGLAFGTAISMHASTGIDTQSTTGPTNDVEVRLHTS